MKKTKHASDMWTKPFHRYIDATKSDECKSQPCSAFLKQHVEISR
jgi:hypothetical protein